LGEFKDTYLFTTDVDGDLAWVISAFSRRWSIEVAVKSSKQIMKVQSPQHWRQESIEKLSPWVWLMQSVVALWYFTEGRMLPEARDARRHLGECAPNSRCVICFAFSAARSCAKQLHARRLQGLTCTNYLASSKTT